MKKNFSKKNIKSKIEKIINEYLKELDKYISAKCTCSFNNNFKGKAWRREVISFIKEINDENYNIKQINSYLIKELKVKENYIEYINYIKIKDEIVWVKVTIDGLEDRIVKLYINETETSFIYFILEDIFKQINNHNEVKNKNEYLIYTARTFFEKSLNEKLNYTDNDLFDTFNFISTLNYEGASIKGKIALIKNTDVKARIKYSTRFMTGIPYDSYRKIRKLIEMCDDTLCLIGDSEQIYGLIEISDIPEETVIIKFLGKFEYSVQYIQEKKEVDILHVKYRLPIITQSEYKSIKLREAIEKVFKNEKVKFDVIDLIINRAVQQKHGTTIVIANPQFAEMEVDNLKSECFLVDKIDFNTKRTEINAVINSLTSIDGALYIDYNGVCYAIGVILDGYVARYNSEGDNSRGARYNSAVRYVNKEEAINNCLIVVISEDSTVDIVYVDDEESKYLEVKENLNTAITLVKEKEYESAIQILKKIIEVDEKNKKANKYLGEIYLNKKDFKNAKIHFDKLIQLAPNDNEVYRKRGYVSHIIGEYDEAITFYNKSIEIHKNDIETYYLKIAAGMKVKQENRANIMADLDRILYINPNSILAHKRRVALGLLWARIDYKVESVHFLREARDSESKLIISVIDYINNKSIDGFKKLLISNQDILNENKYRASSIIEDNYYESKLLRIKEDIKIGNDYFYNHYECGITYMALKNYKAAIEEFNNVLRMEPDCLLIYYIRGWCHYILKEYNKAVDDFLKAKDNDVYIDEIIYKIVLATVGAISTSTENADKYFVIFEKSLKYLKKIEEEEKLYNSNLFYFKGICHYHLGEYELATIDLGIALDINDDITLYKNINDYMNMCEVKINRKKLG